MYKLNFMFTSQGKLVSSYTDSYIKARYINRLKSCESEFLIYICQRNQKFYRNFRKIIELAIKQAYKVALSSYKKLYFFYRDLMFCVKDRENYFFLFIRLQMISRIHWNFFLLQNSNQYRQLHVISVIVKSYQP